MRCNLYREVIAAEETTIKDRASRRSGDRTETIWPPRNASKRDRPMHVFNVQATRGKF